MGIRHITGITPVLFRAACLAVLLTSFTALCHAYDWHDYKERFLAKDGRIKDIYQNGCSHSEGQGYGMLLAVSNNDRAAFDLIWNWAKDNLQVRKTDHLFCWLWGKRQNGKWEVIDFNNASDGDVLIAWALLMASKRWHEEKYLLEAKMIIASIREELSFRLDHTIYILPGYYGFLHDKHLILNPSYQILSAYQDFARVDDAGFWQRACSDALDFLKMAEFSEWRLPPDWALLNRENARAEPASKGPLFGFDAYRVFLYMSWYGTEVLDNGLRALSSYFHKNGMLPCTVDLKRGYTAMKECNAGMYAAVAALARKRGMSSLADKLMERANSKIELEADDYFSATIFLLSKARLVDLS
jgi:endoglucanase